MAQSQLRFHRPARAQLPLADELTLEFLVAQQHIDLLRQAPAPDFLLDILRLLHEEFFFDTVNSFLPLLVDLYPALRQLARLDLLRVESLIAVRPHQLLDLLTMPHVERGAVLERRCAVALAERLRGWIAILAPQAQFLQLLAHRDGRQTELLPEIRLVGPNVGKFLTAFLAHEDNSYSRARRNHFTRPTSTRANVPWCLLGCRLLSSGHSGITTRGSHR